MSNNVKKTIIGVVVVIVILILCTTIFGRKDTDILKEAETELENGSTDGAESITRNAKTRKGKKLHKALYEYNDAVKLFHQGGDIYMFQDKTDFDTRLEETYKKIKGLSGGYKYSKAFKKIVKEKKKILKTAVDYEKDLRKEYKKMVELAENGEDEKCLEIADEWEKKLEESFPADEAWSETIITRLSEFIVNEEALTLMHMNNPTSYNERQENSEAGDQIPEDANIIGY